MLLLISEASADYVGEKGGSRGARGFSKDAEGKQEGVKGGRRRRPRSRRPWSLARPNLQEWPLDVCLSHI